MTDSKQKSPEELKRQYAEIAAVVKERKARRRASRQQIKLHVGEMVRGLVVQAVGTALGAGLIYLVAVASGLLKGTRPLSIALSTLLIVSAFGILAWLVVNLFLRRPENNLTAIGIKLRAEEIRKKVIAGEPLNKNDLALIQLGLVDFQPPAGGQPPKQREAEA
ncbi:hypothetical protein ACQRWP_21945 [Micromonospora trifolii]|uniref:hypothetical protein n=1 Tax=Micromonospora trifolii TaxID=2911208 RepID=UPI003D2ED3B9